MSLSNRQEWEFEYTASTLAAAAQKQRDYRQSRVEVWEGKKAETLQKIKDSGLTVHENVAEKMSSYSNTAGGSAQVLVDTSLQKDLNECVSRIHIHRSAVTAYDGWIQVLNANSESRLKLKHDDWMFFFGK